MIKNIEELAAVARVNAGYTNKNLRYAEHRIYVDVETKEKFLQLFKQQFIFNAKHEQVIIVTNATAFRPDLVSYNQYNTPYLGWLICFANGIKDPYSRKSGLFAGRELVVPSLLAMTLNVMLR